MAVTNYEIEVDAAVVYLFGNVTSGSIDTLSPDTTHFFRIRAKDGSGNVGPWSQKIYLTTPEGDPPVPPTLDQIELWLAASEIEGAVHDDTITTWADGSGNGNDYELDITAGDTAPTYKTNVVNGYPVVRFNNTTNGMHGATLFTVSPPYTVFIVYAQTTGTAASHRVLGDTLANWLVGPFGGKVDYYDNSAFRTGAPSRVANVFDYVTIVVGVTDTVYRVNGVEISTQATGPDHPTTSMTIGHGNAYGESAESDVAEIAITSKDSTADVAAMEAYFATKYGL
jgi:hypothetical protein